MELQNNQVMCFVNFRVYLSKQTKQASLEINLTVNVYG